MDEEDARAERIERIQIAAAIAVPFVLVLWALGLVQFELAAAPIVVAVAARVMSGPL